MDYCNSCGNPTEKPIVHPDGNVNCPKCQEILEKIFVEAGWK